MRDTTRYLEICTPGNRQAYRWLFPILFIGLFSNTLAAQDTIHYDVFFSGNNAGFLKAVQLSPQESHFIFEFNDRGRGPHLEEKMTLDAEGSVTSLRISGNNYLKDAVDERFSINEGTASWVNRSEKGTTSSDETRQYLAINSTLGSFAQVAKLALKSVDNTIGLWPAGELKATLSATIDLPGGLTYNGVAVEGLGFEPQYIWFDAEMNLVGSVSPWLSVVRKSDASSRETLLTLQERVLRDHHKKLAKDLSTPVGEILIRNVDVFNTVDGEILEGYSVLLSGDKISRVFAPGDELPSADEVVDGTGKVLMPGLIDMHTHIARADGIMHIAAGVTSVRDMANSLDLPDLKAEYDSGDVIGPRILIMSGFIDQAGPYAGPTGKIVKSLDEALDAVDFYHDRNYEQIKLYSSIEPEWVAPISDRTHVHGMRLSGHIPSYMLASEAVEAGYDEIQHINMIALNFMSDTIDTRTPLRFSMVGQHAHEIDVEGEGFQSFIDLLLSEEIVVDATVSIFERLLVPQDGGVNPELDEVIERLPIQVRRGNYNRSLPIPEGMERTYANSYLNLLAMTKEMHERGVTVVPGTDAMAGFVYHNELEEYVRAGIPASEVLTMATLTSAKVIGADDILGSVEAGKLADLILIDGAPHKQIGDIRKVEMVFKDGRMYRAHQLYEAIGVTAGN